MTTSYLLDLTNNEYRDDFISLSQSDDSTKPIQFWQYEAREKLVDKLHVFLSDAKKYKEERQENKQRTWLSHNSILVTGKRGTGKTVFLRNLDAMWAADCNDGRGNISKREICFLPEIDPTMLVDHDNFANVVIAQIYTVVEAELNKQACCSTDSTFSEKDRNEFYNQLKKLANSIGKKEEFDGCSGIDKIMQYKSGISIEHHFHNFIEATINILGCNALALPIDDVDMALGRAFEVVDDVRRLLGCPYIIPIVSGDYSLYEQMVNIHFDDKTYRDKTEDGEQKEKGVELARDLTDAYLTKVFPNNMRISLLPIEFIAPKLSLKVDNKNLPISYSDYKNDLFAEFYPLTINEEIINHWPEPTSAREFTQLVRSITPLELKSAEDEPEISYKLWKNFQNWADQKQNGFAYTNCESLLTLKNKDKSEAFDILDLLSFNPKMQLDKKYCASWGEKSFYKTQLNALGGGNVVKVASREQTWRTESIKLLDFAFNKDDKSLSSLPPLEFFHTQKTLVGDRTIIKAFKDIDSQEKLILNTLLSVYTFSDFYTKFNSSYRFVFMSRAFEMIAYSFLINDDIAESQMVFMDILKRKPFYSIFNMAPTKAIQGTSEQDKETEEENTNELGQFAGVSDYLSQEIAQWKQEHGSLFNKVADCNGKLIPILSYIFNKAFTAFHAFRFDGAMNIENEYLTDNIKRFQYMLINAVYTSMIEGSAVTSSVAITPRQKRIRSPEIFNRYDRTLSANKKRYEEQVGSLENDFGVLFIKALETHPIFALIQEPGNGEVKPRLKLGPFEDQPTSESGHQTNQKYHVTGEAIYNGVSTFLRRELERLIMTDVRLKSIRKSSNYTYIRKVLREEGVTAQEFSKFYHQHVEIDFPIGKKITNYNNDRELCFIKWLTLNLPKTEAKK